MNDAFAEQCMGIGDVGPGGDAEHLYWLGHCGRACGLQKMRRVITPIAPVKLVMVCIFFFCGW